MWYTGKSNRAKKNSIPLIDFRPKKLFFGRSQANTIEAILPECIFVKSLFYLILVKNI
jgi:hypothetical protein